MNKDEFIKNAKKRILKIQKAKSKAVLEDDDLYQALEEIHEIVDSGMFYRSTQNIVNAAIDLILENKVTYGTFDLYILNRFLYDFANEYKTYDYVLHNEIKTEDCVLFFEKHGFKIIE